MDITALSKVEEDEKKLRGFLKECMACARAIGKRIEIPYPELIAFVEHAKENPVRYLEVKELLHK